MSSLGFSNCSKSSSGKSRKGMSENKRKFLNTVKTGDILISGRGVGGLIGHAALMVSDDNVLEMAGGEGWQNGIRSNNRKVNKDEWFDEHADDCIRVYRVPNASVARDAANWAYRNYYNPTGGSEKTKHITYRIVPSDIIWSFNPSYCSKLVVQAFHYGTGNRWVLKPGQIYLIVVAIPTDIPSFFNLGYTLQNLGTF